MRRTLYLAIHCSLLSLKTNAHGENISSNLLSHCIGSKMAVKPGPLSGFREIDFKNCKLAPNGSRNSHGNDINPGHKVAFLKSAGVYCLVIMFFHINRSLFKFTHRINEGNKEIMSPEVVSPWPDLPLSIMEPSKEVILPQGLQRGVNDECWWC